MKIALDDIKATPKELAYTEGVDELNARLDRGVHSYRVPRRRAAGSAPRGAAHAARQVTGGRGGRRHGRTQAPDLGEQARQAARARRPHGAARDRLPAMW